MNAGKQAEEWIEKEVREPASETDEAREGEQVKALAGAGKAHIAPVIQLPDPIQAEHEFGSLEISRKDLKAILDQASRYISNKSVMPILAGVHFQVKDGRVCASATDLDMFGVIRVEAAGEGGFEFVAQAKDLKDMVKRLKGNTISVACRKGKVSLSDGMVNLEMATMPPEDFPMRPNGEYQRVVTICMDDLKRVMEAVIPAASRDDKRPTLLGVYFDFRNDPRVVATDSYRCAVYTSDWKTEKGTMLIPHEAFLKLMKLKERKVEVSRSEDGNYVLFESDDNSLYVRSIEGRFPKYVHLFSDVLLSYSLKLVVDPGSFIGAIDAVDYGSTVVMEVEECEIRMSTERRENGLKAKNSFFAKEVERRVLRPEDGDEEIEDKDEVFSIAFNPRFLKDAVSHMDGDVSIYFSDPLKPALFECGDLNYLLMPIRL